MADNQEGSGESSPATAPAAPVITFGTGFGAFAAAAAGGAGFTAFGKPAAAAGEDGDDGADGEGDVAEAEAECTAQFKPLVQLEEVTTATGEEDEEVAFEAKAKSYRFDGEWKEKGTGPLKLLKHKASHKTRLLQRRDKTLKICANFLVLPGVKLTEHSGSDKSVVFTCQDFSEEGAGKQEKFCIRFASVEKMKAFWAAFESAQESNATLLSAEAEKGPRVPADKPEDSGETDKSVSKAAAVAEEEEGEEVSSKAADALADSLGGVKVADKAAA